MDVLIHPALQNAELRSFRPVPVLFVIQRLRVESFRRHSNTCKQQQYQPDIFAVTVFVVALGRPLYVSVSRPPPNLLAQLLL